ncbi:MAG: LVIVD repeat-containing protein, partial [Planctomycetota bacterium]
EVVQTRDTIDPRSEHYNAKSALAKTVRVEDGKMVWGEVARRPDGSENCAHSNSNMSCIACHSSWNPTCYGCHLPQKANMKMPQLHNEGTVSKNYTAYNWQTLRDDVFMLARDGNVTGNKIGPSRSSCAIHVTSYNSNRESIYYQQQTISAEGMSGIAFSTNVPHTFSGRATRECTACHVSEANDNNALLTQLMMLGTGYTNFIGKYCWVGAGRHGFYAVPVTETQEPQAVIGSNLHRLAYPEEYREHVERNQGQLKVAFEHPGRDISEPVLMPGKLPEVLSLQARGEYLYAACGEMGLRVFDISFTDHKGFSERMFTAPVSPLGQKFFVRTRFATSVAAPTTIAPDPTRKHFPENQENPVHPMYAFIYVTDKHEGLVMVGAGTLLDGDPLNNFLKKDVVFNPGNILAGADSITFHGTHAHIGCDAGLVTIDLSNPKEPKVTQVLGGPSIGRPRAMATQGRYGFVADDHALVTLDLSNPAEPRPVSALPFPGLKSLYAARTYLFAAAGHRGIAILDIQNPEQAKVDQVYDADGRINDAHDIKLGATYPSQFGYVADGKNGLRVLQLTTPDTPGSAGFSPRPVPMLVSNYKMKLGGHALCIAKGIDRDRAVDEAGNQLAVFGRLGARPLNLEEMNRLYLRDGKVWRVSNDPAWPGYTLRRGNQKRRKAAAHP